MNAKRVLLAVDDSEVSRRAAAYVAEAVGGSAEYRVRLLSVLPPIPASLLEHGGADDPEAERRLEERIHAERDTYLQQARDEAERVFVEIKQILGKGGVPAEIIETDTFADRIEILGEVDEVASDLLETAQANGFGTIVIGRSHHSRWRELFRRHVSDELVRRARDVTLWVVS